MFTFILVKYANSYFLYTIFKRLHWWSHWGPELFNREHSNMDSVYLLFQKSILLFLFDSVFINYIFSFLENAALAAAVML